MPSFSFVSLTHVCYYTQGWRTQKSLLLITFLWADSQNSMIFIGSSHMWNVGQQCCQECSTSICDYNYDFLICHFIIKCENITNQDKNVGVFKFAPTQNVYTWIHMARGLYILVVWIWGHKIMQCLNQDGIQICTPYQCYILSPFGK